MNAPSRVLLVLALLLFGARRLSAADPEAKPPSPNYYPLKEGSQWTYQLEVGGQPRTIVNRIAKVETIDGQSLARLETEMNGNVVASEHLNSTDKGVFRHRFNGIEVVPPICLLKLPVKDGESWTDQVKLGQEDLKVACTAGKEDVEVPAGKFAAVRVKVAGKQAGQDVVSTYWYAKDVGIVKQKIELGDKVFIIDLAKYEPAK